MTSSASVASSPPGTSPGAPSLPSSKRTRPSAPSADEVTRMPRAPGLVALQPKQVSTCRRDGTRATLPEVDDAVKSSDPGVMTEEVLVDLDAFRRALADWLDGRAALLARQRD